MSDPPVRAERTDPATPTTAVTAPLALRAASWGIDAAVTLSAVSIFSGLSGWLGALVLFLGLPAYYVGMEGHFGVPTLGHRIMALHVVDRRSGSTADVTLYAIRLVACALFAVPLAVPWVLSVRHHWLTGSGTWHDAASQTIVTTSR